MSDKLQFVGGLPEVAYSGSLDKLKFVGHQVAIMNNLSLINTGRSLSEGLTALSHVLQYAINATILLALALLVARLIIDKLNLNPFGRVANYARRPTDEVFRRVRGSQLYFALRQALRFDPTVIMALIALAILWFVVSSVVGQMVFVLSAVARSLQAFGSGEMLTGLSLVTGAVLLAVLFFLLTLMTIIFVNSFFGLLRRPAYWAMERIGPLLRLFDFGGALSMFAFLFLFLALSFAAQAVQAIFF